MFSSFNVKFGSESYIIIKSVPWTNILFIVISDKTYSLTNKLFEFLDYKTISLTIQLFCVCLPNIITSFFLYFSFIYNILICGRPLIIYETFITVEILQ